MHKIPLAATHPGFWWREGRVDKSPLSKDWGLWVWGQSWRDSWQDPCAESPFHNAHAIFLGEGLPSIWHQPGGKQYCHPLESLWPHFVELAHFWGGSCLGWGVEVQAASVCVTELCGFGTGAIPPTFPWTWLVLPSHRRYTSSNSMLLVVPPFRVLLAPPCPGLGKSGADWVVWLCGEGAPPGLYLSLMDTTALWETH